MKSKLTEKYDNPLLFAAVEQNRPIIIISLASLESRPVLNFVDKAIILKQTAAILKEDANTFVEKTSDVSWPPTIDKLSKYSRRPYEIILKFCWYVISTEISYHSVAYDFTNLLLMSFSENRVFGIFNWKFLALNSLQ